ncbi:hypothetical protein F0U63_44050 [Cystobacter fuscus]|nr:hypothetical protein F0U63_44050 [Cystobacter fuscus]
MMPLHLFYDFDMSTREDALVTMRDAEGGELYDKFETLYEMLAWGAVLEFRIFRMPQQCGGVVVGDCPEFLSRLDPVMESLGFAEPLSTGSLCRLYERSDAAMICNRAPRVGLGDRRAFMLGGSSAGSLRRILGEIATQPSLEVRVGEWTPKLQ